MIYLLIYVLLLSGSVCAAAFGKKKTALPYALTPLAMTALMYLFALTGIMRAGAYCTVLLAGLLIAVSLLHTLRKRNWRDFCARMFTPSFIIFTVVFLFCLLTSRRMAVHRWDEFSHWAYSVQEMLLNDQMYTSPLSDDMFKAYPPGISLWWYIWQVLYQALSGDTLAHGALFFVTMQTFTYSLLIPFTHRLHLRMPGRTALTAAAVIALPLVVYEVFLQRIYVDTTLGLTAGFVFALIATGQWKKPLGLVTLLLAAMMLVWLKDAGLAFAVRAVVYLMLSVCLQQKRTRYDYCAAVLLLLSVVIAKGTWQMHLSSLNIAGTSMHVDIGNLLQLITGQAPDSYRHEVARKFAAFIFGYSMRVTAWRLPVSYFAMIMLLLAALFSLRRVQPGGTRQAGVLFAAALLTSVVYIWGQMLLYMYFFEPAAALELPSGSRYLKALMLCLFTVCFALSAELAGRKNASSARRRAACAMLTLFLLSTDQGALLEHINGSDVIMTTTQAAPCQQAGARAADNTGGSPDNRARVYMVLQCEEDLDFYATRYYLRPCAQVNTGMWNFAPDGNEVTEEMWQYTPCEWSQRIADERVANVHNAWNLSPERWAQALYEGYDYVYVSTADAYFAGNFSHLFEGGRITDNSMYSVCKAPDGSITLQLL